MENKSDVLILDAQNQAAGPIATIKVPEELNMIFTVVLSETGN